MPAPRVLTAHLAEKGRTPPLSQDVSSAAAGCCCCSSFPPSPGPALMDYQPPAVLPAMELQGNPADGGPHCWHIIFVRACELRWWRGNRRGIRATCF